MEIIGALYEPGMRGRLDSESKFSFTAQRVGNILFSELVRMLQMRAGEMLKAFMLPENKSFLREPTCLEARFSAASKSRIPSWADLFLFDEVETIRGLPEFVEKEIPVDFSGIEKPGYALVQASWQVAFDFLKELNCSPRQMLDSVSGRINAGGLFPGTTMNYAVSKPFNLTVVADGISSRDAAKLIEMFSEYSSLPAGFYLRKTVDANPKENPQIFGMAFGPETGIVSARLYFSKECDFYRQIKIKEKAMPSEERHAITKNPRHPNFIYCELMGDRIIKEFIDFARNAAESTRFPKIGNVPVFSSYETVLRQYARQKRERQ